MHSMLIRMAVITFLIESAIGVPILLIGNAVGWSQGAIGSAVLGAAVVGALIGSMLYDRELRKLGRR